ncbi:hypothetical protein, partial [Citrobacter europaeus]|uniref:hypothetical protein n=1 Tax=Citrobacter europaeus TaxID=1914243 RepID=UPI003979CBFA
TTAVSDIQVSVRAGSTGTMVPADKKVSFVADSATAQVKSVLLQGDEVSRVADGSSSFRYAVTVTDANGNPVADQ